MKKSIIIDKPVDVVFDYVQMEFAKAFKCSPQKLLNKQLKLSQKNNRNYMVDMVQVIVKHDKNQAIVFTNTTKADIITVQYLFEGQGEFTQLTIIETSQGNDSIIHSLYHTLNRLPLISLPIKSRIQTKLEQLKDQIEEL